MSKRDDELLVILAPVMVAVIIILAAYTSLSMGLVLYKFWGWFLVPYFDVVEISYPLAIGLMAFKQFVMMRADIRKEETDNGKLFWYLMAPWLFLLQGWIVSHFL